MITSNTRAFAAQSATTPLAPFSLQRRTVGPTDVRIKIAYCGVCHSDLHQVRNEWGGTNYPIVPGHEIVGEVTEVGPAVTKFKLGDRVGVGCLVDSCRECESCKQGLEQFCSNGTTGTYNGKDKISGGFTYGGYSDQVVVEQNFVLLVPENLPLEAVAPLLCAGITTYSPLRHWKIGPGHKVAVVGLGGLGHMAVKFAASFGAEVTMLSTNPTKEKDAKHLGAHYFALTTEPSELALLQNKFDYILNTVSAPHDYNNLLGLLNVNGVMICVGVPPVPMQFRGFSLLRNRRSIAGSSIGGIKETQEMLDYCGKHNITSEIELIPINYINEAYDRMVKGDVKYRFVIDMKTL